MKRRDFLKTAAATAATFHIVPRCVLGGPGQTPPSRKLNLASIGVGGMGGVDLGELAKGPVNVVAICDVDDNNLAAAAKKHPGAKPYIDWRKLLDEQGGRIDAVNVATPDNMHAPIAMSAILRGKHVYCQKPLTHDLYEARQLAAAARNANVVAQMGIQCHSTIEYRMASLLIQGGAIGKVKEVHAWSNRPGWPQGRRRQPGEDPVPANLHWNLWLGVAPLRPFLKDAYAPFVWRGILDFGCGALGDMGCHIIDPPFAALKLASPISVRTEGPGCTDDQFPTWEIVHYEFPATEFTAGPTLPLTWYDGHHAPDPALLAADASLHMPDNGSIFVGEKGVMLLPHVGGPQLLPRKNFIGYKYPKLKGHDHWQQWIHACLGEDKPSANFDFAGPLTETVLLGVLSSRFPGQKIEWNADKLQVANLSEANRFIRRRYREGWEVKGL